MCSGDLDNSLLKSMYLSKWSTSFEFNVHHILHTGRGEQSGKCCSISCCHAPGHKLTKKLPISKER